MTRYEIRAEIERLCMDAYERGAHDAAASLVDAFQKVGMHDAARLAADSLPRLKVSNGE